MGSLCIFQLYMYIYMYTYCFSKAVCEPFGTTETSWSPVRGPSKRTDSTHVLTGGLHAWFSVPPVFCRWPKKGLIHIPFCLGQLERFLCFAVKASLWCPHILSWPFVPPLHKFVWLMIHKFTFDPTIFFLKIIQCLLIGNKKKKRSNMYPAWQLFPSLPVSWSSTFQLIFCFIHICLFLPLPLPSFYQIVHPVFLHTAVFSSTESDLSLIQNVNVSVLASSGQAAVLKEEVLG